MKFFPLVSICLRCPWFQTPAAAHTLTAAENGCRGTWAASPSSRPSTTCGCSIPTFHRYFLFHPSVSCSLYLFCVCFFFRCNRLTFSLVSLSACSWRLYRCWRPGSWQRCPPRLACSLPPKTLPWWRSTSPTDPCRPSSMTSPLLSRWARGILLSA